MTFDIISTIELTLGAAIVSVALTFSAAATPQLRLRLGAVLAAWFALVVTMGATGVLGANGFGPPGLAAAVVLPIAALAFAFFARDSVKSALMSTPLAALIAIHTVRVAGFTFVLLYWADRLPAPFAPMAGWGDVLVGLTAPFVAWRAWRDQADAVPLVLGWNTIGLLDLIDAVSLGAMSSPGPLQVFGGSPDSTIMTSLPWLLIPGFLVPMLMFVHLVIFYRLARRGRVNSGFARA